MERSGLLEKVIGIFDEQPTYADRLKKYINERKDIGCYAVTFHTEEELVQFFERKKAGSLITGEETAKNLYEHGIILPLGVSQWVLTEEKKEEDGRYLFRYQRAGDLVRKILLTEAAQSEALSNLYTVFSPESSAEAFTFAQKLAGVISAMKFSANLFN